MAVYAETAFDRLEWSYLYEVLNAYNFPQEITQLIQTIYKTPTAYVYTNEILSEAVQIARGTRQGCPLSPTFTRNYRAIL